MSKGKYHEEPESPENHERYIITYSDLITLLLALFIIMYSMASVDAGKYAQVSAALANALGGASDFSNFGAGPSVLEDTFITDASGDDGLGDEGDQKQIDQLEQKVNELIEKYNLKEYITVQEEERGLDIEIRNELMNISLFESGSAELNTEVMEIVNKLGLLLKDIPNYVRIEGHTDIDPISRGYYKSNWELSTSRATNVVKYFIEQCGLNPIKLSAVGYGEYKPVADNSTKEGKAKNRRVNIVIIRSKYNAIESQ